MSRKSKSVWEKSVNGDKSNDPKTKKYSQQISKITNRKYSVHDAVSRERIVGTNEMGLPTIMTDNVSSIYTSPKPIPGSGGGAAVICDLDQECIDQYTPYGQRPETYIVPLLFAIIFVVGVLGNGTLIVIFLRHRAMRNIPNTWVSLFIHLYKHVSATVKWCVHLCDVCEWTLGRWQCVYGVQRVRN